MGRTSTRSDEPGMVASGIVRSIAGRNSPIGMATSCSAGVKRNQARMSAAVARDGQSLASRSITGTGRSGWNARSKKTYGRPTGPSGPVGWSTAQSSTGRGEKPSATPFWMEMGNVTAVPSRRAMCAATNQVRSGVAGSGRPPAASRMPCSVPPS